MKKTDRRKTLKNNERKKKNTKNQVTMNIFSFTFYVKNYILLKNCEKSSFCHFIYSFHAL